MSHLQLRERVTAGQLELKLNQIEPGDCFGDRVFDLQARIGLDKRERCLLAVVVFCIPMAGLGLG